MIRFCTEQSEMIELIKELKKRNNYFYIFRNLNINLTHKKLPVKYLVQFEPQPRKLKNIKHNPMLWWKEAKRNVEI